MRRGGRAADGAWKRVLTDLLPEFLTFTLPALHAATDWSIPPTFLDKEFQSIARQAAVGSRIADLIVELHLRSGQIGLLVLHVEVQGQAQPDFAARMFTYYALIHLRLWRQRRRAPARARRDAPLILGIAVLTDDRDAWRPDPYEARGFGLGIRYDYHVLKLRDPQVRAAAQAMPDNPFALVARIWLDLQATGRREDDAATAVRSAPLALRAGRYGDEHLAAILAFIEQAMTLPVARYRALVDEVIQSEGAAMAQVMSYIERKGWRRGRAEGREEGREEGRLDVLLRLVGRTAGPVDDTLLARLQALGADTLLELADATLAFTGPADLERWLDNHGV